MYTGCRCPGYMVNAGWAGTVWFRGPWCWAYSLFHCFHGTINYFDPIFPAGLLLKLFQTQDSILIQNSLLLMFA
jgi:hypothetical protein